MSFLNYLQFQQIDQSSNIPTNHQPSDDISLDESVDEASLEQYWSRVEEDIHNDPEWFHFSDE